MTVIKPRVKAFSHFREMHHRGRRWQAAPWSGWMTRLRRPRLSASPSGTFRCVLATQSDAQLICAFDLAWTDLRSAAYVILTLVLMPDSPLTLTVKSAVLSKQDCQ